MRTVRMRLDLKRQSDLTVEERSELERLDRLGDDEIDFSDIPELEASFWQGVDGQLSRNTQTMEGGGSRYRFEIIKDRAGEFYVRFHCANELIFETSGFPSQSKAESAVDLLRMDAPDTPMDTTS